MARLDVARLQAVCADAWDGLAHLNRFFLHGDVKPANVLIELLPTGGVRGVVADIDDMIARTAAERAENESGAGTIVVLSTPFYGSPFAHGDVRRDQTAMLVTTLHTLGPVSPAAVLRKKGGGGNPCSEKCPYQTVKYCSDGSLPSAGQTIAPRRSPQVHPHTKLNCCGATGDTPSANHCSTVALTVRIFGPITATACTAATQTLWRNAVQRHHSLNSCAYSKRKTGKCVGTTTRCMAGRCGACASPQMPSRRQAQTARSERCLPLNEPGEDCVPFLLSGHWMSRRTQNRAEHRVEA